MKHSILALGLSALLAAPATAATLFQATASVAITNVSAQGLNVTYSGTADLDAQAIGSFGSFAQALEIGLFFNGATQPAPVPSGGLNFGAQVSGVTPSNPDADSGASAFYERSVTLSFANETDTRRQARFDNTLSYLARAASDGLSGETSFARTILSLSRNGVVQSTTISTRQRLVGETGTVEGGSDQTFSWILDVSPFTTETITYTLRVEGNSAASAANLTPVPLPATAPLLAVALLGAGVALRRRAG
jgi:hypothetical protein